MVSAEERELRRHALRFVARTEDGEQNTRILYHQLADVGYRITWREFDEVLMYLERAGCLTVEWTEREVSRMRQLRITQRGLDIVQGTVADPGIMPPVGGDL